MSRSTSSEQAWPYHWACLLHCTWTPCSKPDTYTWLVLLIMGQQLSQSSLTQLCITLSIKPRELDHYFLTSVTYNPIFCRTTGLTLLPAVTGQKLALTFLLASYVNPSPITSKVGESGDLWRDCTATILQGSILWHATFFAFGYSWLTAEAPHISPWHLSAHHHWELILHQHQTPLSYRSKASTLTPILNRISTIPILH